jgi:DNA-binding transcriptional regulator YiaG
VRPIPVGLRTANPKTAIAELERLGIHAREIKEPRVEIQQVRIKQHLSQQEFAMLYGLELDTLQNWEQERYAPDRATHVLMKLIEVHPSLVVQMLTDDGNENFRSSFDLHPNVSSKCAVGARFAERLPSPRVDINFQSGLVVSRTYNRS